MAVVSETWPALCAIAVSLGLRHGFDADHLAVVDGLVRRNATQRPNLARVAGILFSLGHGAVVVLVASMAVAMASRWHAPLWLEPAGMIVSLVVLSVLAALNLYAVWATPPNTPVTPVGLRSKMFGRAFASDHPIVLLIIGALFAISADTLAQAAGLGLAASQFGGVREAAIVATCFAMGTVAASGVNGFWMARLIRRANRRAAIASRIMTGAVGLISMGVALLVLADLASLRPVIAPLSGSAWPGVAILVAVSVAFVFAMLASRRRKQSPNSTAQRSVFRASAPTLPNCSDEPSLPHNWSQAA